MSGDVKRWGKRASRDPEHAEEAEIIARWPGVVTEEGTFK